MNSFLIASELLRDLSTRQMGINLDDSRAEGQR